MEQKGTRIFSLVLFIIGLFLVVIALSSCNHKSKNPPSPVNGILDLRNWNFKKDGDVRTTGYWEFYFKGFLNSRQFDTVRLKKYAWVPGVWKRAGLGATGYASYNLTVLFPASRQDIAFQLHTILTAYRFFINDSLVANCGTVAASKERSQPQFLENQIVTGNVSDTMRLTFWVSNYDYRKGGLSSAVIIGDVDHISTTIRNRLEFIYFLTGLYVMACFILLCFFAYRPKQTVILFMFLWALATVIRLISAEDRIITTIFPGISFDLLVKMELISGFGMGPFCIMAMHIIFPKEFPRLFRDLVMYPFLVFTLVTIFTPPIFYSYWVVPYQIINVLSLAYACFCLILAMKHRREASGIMGVAIFIAVVVYSTQVISFMTLSNFRFGSGYLSAGLVFSFAQILLLAKIFSGALKRVENFAGELETTVKERTGELVKAQEQLILNARHAETEKVRRRISQDIHDDISSGLNRISWMTELVKVKAQKYKPEEMNPTLDKIIKSSRETVDNLVEIIWSLNPGSDDLENMLVYMRNYITRFFEDTSFKVTVNFPEHPEKIELNPELKRNLFLVMKEALHNAAKYSKARNIIIDFNFADSSYLFTISDDGIGMEEGVVKGTGNGMINMRKRMDAVNGSFIVQSEPGKGTKIVIEGKFYQ